MNGLANNNCLGKFKIAFGHWLFAVQFALLYIVNGKRPGAKGKWLLGG